MALNSLSELVSVTDSAVKSLNNSNSNSNVNVYKHAGSPFDSPRSLSLSDSGVEKTRSTSEPSFPRGIESRTKNTVKRNGKTEIRSDEDANSNGSKEDAIVDTDVDLKYQQMTRNKMNRSIGSENSNCSGKYSNASVQSKSLSDIQSKKVRVQRHEDDGGNTNKANQAVNQDSRDKVFTSQLQNGKEFIPYLNDPQIIDVVSHDVEIDNQSSENDSSQDHVSEENNSKDVNSFGHKSFGKTLNANCQSLKQGDLNKGVFDPTKARVFDDVYISQFQLTEKQRDLKEALAKRSESNQPKRKQVQPQIIQHKHIRNEDSYSDQQSDVVSSVPHNAFTPATDSAMTAAVAASAAVAATQPFLKIQHDLESQIKQLVTQLAEIQQNKPSTTSNLGANDVTTTAGKRISHLEHQVTELNERRLEHIESLQQQQLQMQAQLLMLSRTKSPRTEVYSTKRQKSPHRGTVNGSHIPRPITISRESKSIPMNGYTSSHSYDTALGQSQSSTFNPNALSKHYNYLSEVRELQGSLLDTPAPRKNVPQPTPYTLPEEQHKHLGFLQELLDKKGTPNHDTTFSVAPAYEQNK